jgi:hypothetical protein
VLTRVLVGHFHLGLKARGFGNLINRLLDEFLPGGPVQAFSLVRNALQETPAKLFFPIRSALQRAASGTPESL